MSSGRELLGQGCEVLGIRKASLVSNLNPPHTRARAHVHTHSQTRTHVQIKPGVQEAGGLICMSDHKNHHQNLSLQQGPQPHTENLNVKGLPVSHLGLRILISDCCELLHILP